MERATGERNWAGNYLYAAARIERPTSLDELQALVAASPQIRALGSRHTFNALTDTAGVLVDLAGLPAVVEVDEAAHTATVPAAIRYGDLAIELQRRGWALGNLASLPHITVAGAIATSTHGSGTANQSMAAAVAALDLLGPDGEVRRVARGDTDFDGSVVGLGGLGIVTRATLDIEPTYDVRQDVFTDLPWEPVLTRLDDLLGCAYSVSLVTDWRGDTVKQAWLKSRSVEPPTLQVPGARATSAIPMLAGASADPLTDQSGIPGPWLERLPHFRMGFTPSRGAELQSEYYLPRAAGVEAIGRLRGLAERLAPVLQSTEIRTVAADSLWLSGAYDADVIAFHFTWVLDEPGVHAVLPAVEDALLPLGGRPHWGKVFRTSRADLETCYPRLGDFARLRAARDPDRKFGNEFLRRLLDAP